MALLIEDGSGSPGANSYVSVADADAYFTARGIAAWTGTSVSKEAALLRACQYLENAYRGRWKGYRVHELQGLAWPRSSAKPYLYADAPAQVMPSPTFLRDIDGWLITPSIVPQAVKNAQCEAALLSLQNVPLTTTPSPALKSASQSLDRASWSEAYAAAVSQRDPRLLAIDDLLIGLLISAPGSTFGNVPVMRG